MGLIKIGDCRCEVKSFFRFLQLTKRGHAHLVAALVMDVLKRQIAERVDRRLDLLLTKAAAVYADKLSAREPCPVNTLTTVVAKIRHPNPLHRMPRYYPSPHVEHPTMRHLDCSTAGLRRIW